MFGIENLCAFLAAGILLNLYPGPDTLYIVGRSLSQGRGAGVSAALGIGTGGFVHTLFGAFGVSAVLAASSGAFTILKFAGCAYLLYQGAMLLYGASGRGPSHDVVGKMKVESLGRIYWQGALTNILNPKVALFFLAFLPQFISVSSPSKPLSFVILGLFFIMTGTTWCLLVAVFASTLGARMQQSPAIAKKLRIMSGILFMLIGLRLATARMSG